MRALPWVEGGTSCPLVFASRRPRERGSEGSAGFQSRAEGEARGKEQSPLWAAPQRSPTPFPAALATEAARSLPGCARARPARCRRSFNAQAPWAAHVGRLRRSVCVAMATAAQRDPRRRPGLAEPAAEPS